MTDDTHADRPDGAPLAVTATGTRPALFPVVPVAGHALLDCGHGEKLERFGGLILRRPDPQAMWAPAADRALWDRADFAFRRESDRGGRWEGATSALPEPWQIEHRGACFKLGLTPFKHVGLFPEQAGNWDFSAECVAAIRGATGEARPAVLNLFGYTGAATILASRAGAFVTHVDASRPALRWARENAALSQLPADAIRWIEDDAATFVKREGRRGRRYRLILLDPPPYGRGPDGQLWNFEERIAELLSDLAALLEDGPAALLLSAYAVATTPLALANLLAELPAGGSIESGELALAPESGGPLLPAGLCARWWRPA